jgi:hypothetical protein
VGETSTKNVLWRRHERATECVYGPAADISLRSAAVGAIPVFPVVPDPAVGPGVMGDILDPTFGPLELGLVAMSSQMAWDGLGLGAIGLNIVNLRRFVGPAGAPSGLLGIAYIPVDVCGMLLAPLPGSPLTVFVSDNAFTHPASPLLDPSLSDVPCAAAGVTDLILAHEVGHALSLFHGNGIDEDGDGLLDEDPVTILSCAGTLFPFGDGADSPWDCFDAAADEDGPVDALTNVMHAAWCGPTINGNALTAAQATQVFAEMLTIPGIVMDPPEQVSFTPILMDSRADDLGEPGVEVPHLDISFASIGELTEDGVFFGQVELVGAVPGSEGVEAITALDLDRDAGTGGSPGVELGLPLELSGVELVVVCQVLPGPPQEMRWEPRSPLVDPRTDVGVEGAAASLIGGTLYVSHGFRGFDSNFLSIYDVATDAWTHGGPDAPDAFVARSEMAGGTALGRHYGIGGRTGPNADCEEFDPLTGAWRAMEPMSIARGGLGAASLDDLIYAAGGRDGGTFGSGTVFDLFEVFDPAAAPLGAWTMLSPLPIPVADNYAMAALAGKVYVFGGALDSNTVTGEVQIYDIATDTWSFGQPMPTPRAAAMAGVIGNRIAVFGGFDPSLGNLQVTEIYDPQGDSWTAGPDMPEPVSEIAQGMTSNGTEVFAVGSGIFGASRPVVYVLQAPGPRPLRVQAFLHQGGQFVRLADPSIVPSLGQRLAFLCYDQSQAAPVRPDILRLGHIVRWSMPASLRGPQAQEFRSEVVVRELGGAPGGGAGVEIDRLMSETMTFALPEFPQCQLEPFEAFAGDRVTMSAQGLEPDARAHLLLGDGAIAEGRTDANGDVSIEFVVPSDLAPGPHGVTIGTDVAALTADCRLTVLEVPPGGTQRPGDCNQDGSLDISDAICLLGTLFLGTPARLPCGNGLPDDLGNLALVDANGDNGVDISDGIAILRFLFAGGPPHVLGTGCVRILRCPDNERCE